MKWLALILLLNKCYLINLIHGTVTFFFLSKVIAVNGLEAVILPIAQSEFIAAL